MTKKVLVIIISLLCLAVLVTMIMFCGIGVWIGNFKYYFDPTTKKAYFIDYRGDGTDVLPYEIKGFNVEMTDFTCMVGNYKCSFNIKPNKIYIDSFEGKGEFVLPAKLLGRDVYYVDRIENNDNITSVYIENNADDKRWGVNLRYCQNIESVAFEEGTKVIYTDICHSPKLKTIKFPEGVKEIHGAYASNGLEEVYFPKSVVYVSGSSFNWTNFVKNHEDEKYYVVGDNVLLFYNGSIDEIIIPEGIKYLYNYHLFDIDNDVLEKKMYLSKSLCRLNVRIPENVEAFFGTNEVEGLDKCTIEGTLVAPEGSYIQEYCEENGLNFRVMTEEEEAIWREKTEAAASEITYQD
ncbi:leucine-rich repeat protein [Pseudobutyrivibrio sp. MD2005]|uniref:leucine-rich repeat protein n=1 Tax=Pseudobutyrivibrio sp. MD2005 TaxID=1410616 RepID=UPI000483F276|nr:leucine-rich repeat protein [Pseudobutyrivibrio sp. MD2005]